MNLFGVPPHCPQQIIIPRAGKQCENTADAIILTTMVHRERLSGC
jgi:hypothetical protein